MFISCPALSVTVEAARAPECSPTPPWSGKHPWEGTPQAWPHAPCRQTMESNIKIHTSRSEQHGDQLDNSLCDSSGSYTKQERNRENAEHKHILEQSLPLALHNHLGQSGFVFLGLLFLLLSQQVGLIHLAPMLNDTETKDVGVRNVKKGERKR